MYKTTSLLLLVIFFDYHMNFLFVVTMIKKGYTKIRKYKNQCVLN